MDVNGTRFHLIRGADDWHACREERAENQPARIDYDADLGALTLRPLPALYRPDRPGLPLTPDDRRGAGVDRFGNRYWIGAERRSIWWGDPRGGRPQCFWTWAPRACPPAGDEFVTLDPAPETPDTLAGLAVTEQHYLVAGSAGRGLYIFDLYAGAEPLLITLAPGVPFDPFDIAPAPGGGVWVLDRANQTYWGFDARFRVIGEPASMHTIEPGEEVTFHPLGSSAVTRPPQLFPTGFPLAAPQPLAIEALPDGSVLILARPAAGEVASAIYRYRLSTRLAGPLPLSAEMGFDLGSGVTNGMVEIVAHDIAFLPGEARDGKAGGVLYAAEDGGKQVLSFDLRYDTASLSNKPRAEYLPMHAFGGRALIADLFGSPPSVLYDLAAGTDRHRDTIVRWVAARSIDQPRYETSAMLVLDTRMSTATDLPALDGKERGCVWHRLFVDGCLPAETGVDVYTRASDTRADLEALPFYREPGLYLRGDGPEVPYYQSLEAGTDLARGRGTWELLFQAARGRFLQVRLVLSGNGRATPQLHTVRVAYPRFSYARRFLPTVYLEEATSADLTERLLANHEGTLSVLESKIALAGSIFDPRSAPPEALDWLAGWWGLLLDPLWAQVQQRRPAGLNVDRRRLFIRFARKLYERRGTPDGIRFALMLLLDPCLEALLKRLMLAALRLDVTLRDSLAAEGLPYPTPTTSELELEDTLYDYLLAPQRPSSIRVVERFRTRGGRGRVQGDPNSPADESDAAVAHHFTVLLPERLDPDEAAMVQRVVDLEKPAHTRFDVRRYFDFFRAGEARLGLESALGAEGRFVAMILDRHYLAEGYLAPAPPEDARDRLVAGRDRVGLLPPL